MIPILLPVLEVRSLQHPSVQTNSIKSFMFSYTSFFHFSNHLFQFTTTDALCTSRHRLTMAIVDKAVNKNVRRFIASTHNSSYMHAIFNSNKILPVNVVKSLFVRIAFFIGHGVFTAGVLFPVFFYRFMLIRFNNTRIDFSIHFFICILAVGF